MTYRRRIIDEALDELLPELAAIALEGAKAVGKTATGAQRARTVIAAGARGVGGGGGAGGERERAGSV